MITGINYTNNEDNISMDCLTSLERLVIKQLLIKEHNESDNLIVKEACELILNKIYINWGVETDEVNDDNIDDMLDELRGSIE